MDGARLRVGAHTAGRACTCTFGGQGRLAGEGPHGPCWPPEELAERAARELVVPVDADPGHVVAPWPVGSQPRGISRVVDGPQPCHVVSACIPEHGHHMPSRGDEHCVEF